MIVYYKNWMKGF